MSHISHTCHMSDFNCLDTTTGLSDDIYDRSEISAWLFPAGSPCWLLLPESAGGSNKSHRCLWICQSSNYNVDITGMAHQTSARLPVACAVCALILFAPVCMSLLWAPPTWTVIRLRCGITLNHCFGSRHAENSNALGGPRWPTLSCTYMEMFSGEIPSAGRLKILKRICQQKKLSHQLTGYKHVSQGSVHWYLCAPAERGPEAGALPQFHPAEARSGNQVVPPEPHRLCAGELWGQQAARAAESRGGSSSAQPFFSGIQPTGEQHGLQVGRYLWPKGASS